MGCLQAVQQMGIMLTASEALDADALAYQTLPINQGAWAWLPTTRIKHALLHFPRLRVYMLCLRLVYFSGRFSLSLSSSIWRWPFAQGILLSGAMARSLACGGSCHVSNTRVSQPRVTNFGAATRD